MKITVVTVCYNSVAHIGDALRSLDLQEWKDLEHVVIDGASQDGTLDILRAHSQPWRKVISEPDRGVYDAMNKGIDAASGEVVGFLNADDFYNDRAVLADVAAVFRDSSVEACYGDLVYVDQQDTDRIIRYWRSRSYCDGLFENGWMPAHPTFFARRSVYEKYGKFDLSFEIQSDFELTMRLLRIGRIRSVYLPRLMVKMRMGGITNRSLRNIIKGNLEAYRACKLHQLNVSPLFIARKILSRVPQFLIKPSSSVSR